jgi:uncharacterized protein YkwD
MRSTRIALLLGSLATVAGLLFGSAPAGAQDNACDGANALPASETTVELASTITCLINVERSGAGLAPLGSSGKLVRAAKVHAADMIVHRYFDHTGHDGSEPLQRARRAGYLKHVVSFSIGENLADGYGPAGTPASMVDDWMASPEHRANILDPRFRQIGVAVKRGMPSAPPGSPLNNGAATYSVLFGAVKKG